MLGKTIVFRTMRGKTIMANRPARPTKQSEQQRSNRSKFKEATTYAKTAMLDPVKKEYYQAKAKKLKLPNAYTAAITDYMRKPVMTVINKSKDGARMVVISKKGFRMEKIELYKRNKGEAPQLLRSLAADSCNYELYLRANEISPSTFLKIYGEMGKVWIINLL